MTATLEARVRTRLTTSVIVCCYTTERWDQVLAALDSLHHQTWPPDEIIVVVDHNPQLLARLRGRPGLRVLANTGPRGLSGARNTGLTASQCDVVAFLDDDALADRDWVATMLESYADPGVVGVGGHVEPAWQTGRPAWFPPEFDWVVGCSHPGLPATTAPVRNFIGANMSFRRCAAAELGGFRTDLGRVGTRPVGCEETEFCIRIAESRPDAVLEYRPDAIVRHHVPADRGSWSYFRRRCYAEGVSKAVVSGLTGADRALSSERGYVLRVLPRGVAAAVRTGEPARAAAIVAGLAATVAGYLAGRLRRERYGIAAASVLVAALALFAWSLRGVDLRAMDDLGLSSVLPVTYWLALAAIVGATVVLIHRDRCGDGLLTAYLAGLIVVLHATPAILYGSLRYAWAWKHVGIVDYIVRHGAVHPDSHDIFTAYHAWPGFFALNAVLVKAGGLHSALSYAAWAPAAFGLAALVPLRVLFGTLARDRRQARLALVLFYLANWVGQDYFSPQAFSYLLYLVVLVVCLRLLPARPMPHRRTILALVTLLMLTIVSSHQLTPLMLLSALTALALARRIRPVWLPLLLAALEAAWISLVGMGFLRQNIHWIAASIGRPADNAQTFVDLSRATVQQRIVDFADRGLTAGLILLAVAGWWRLGRRGAPRTVPAVLAVAPVPLLVANTYGGEMIFRVYLFALPFLALLAAGVVYPRRRHVAVPLLLVALMAVPFCLAYYGKERMNYFTPQERAASAWLYTHAPAGSTIVGANANLPWAYTRDDAYTYAFLENEPAALRAALPRRPLSVLQDTLGRARPAFVVLTRSEQIAARYTGTLPAQGITALAVALTRDPGARLVFHNADAQIFELDAGAGP